MSNVFLAKPASSDPKPPWSPSVALQSAVRRTRRAHRSKTHWVMFPLAFVLSFGLCQSPLFRFHALSAVQASLVRVSHTVAMLGSSM
jgi:hypothetical protein